MRCALALLAMIGLCEAANAASPVRIVVSSAESGCLGRTAAARLEEGWLRISGLQPGRRFSLEIQESGIDILVATGPSEQSTSDRAPINSEPSGYAVEPLIADADARGEIHLGIEIGKRFSWAQLHISVRCRVALTTDPSDPVRARSGIAQKMSIMRSGSNQTTTVAALSALLLLQRALFTAQTHEDRIWVLFQLGSLAKHGNYPIAEQHWFELAAAESKAAGDERSELWALRMAASTKLKTGQADADAAFAEVQRRSRELGLTDLLAGATYARCVLMRVAGEATAAVECYDSSAAGFRALGDVLGESTAARSKATALLYLGRYDEAQLAVNRALALAERGNSEDLIVRAKIVLAQLARWGGDFERSLSLLQEAYVIEQKTGRQNELARIERIIATTYELAEEPARAEFYYLASLARTESEGNELVSLDIRIDFASMLSQSGQLRRSLEVLGPAIEEATGKAPTSLLAEAALQQATTLLELEDRSGALAALLAGEPGLDSLHWRHKTRWQALRLRLGKIEDARAAQLELSTSIDDALASGDLTLAMDAAEVLVSLWIAGEDKAKGLSLALRIVERGIATARKLRSPSLRNSLLSRLKWFAAVPMVELPEGESAQSRALHAIRFLEALRATEQSPFRGDGTDNSTLELERVLSGETGSDGSPSPEREALILAIASDDAKRQRTPDDDSPPVSEMTQLSQQPGNAIIYFVLSGPRPGALTFSGLDAVWRSGLDSVALAAAVQSLEITLRTGHTDREEIDSALDLVVDKLGWSNLLSGETKRLSIVADSTLATLPWGMLPSPDDPGKPLIDSTELVSLQSLRTAINRPADSLRIIAATSPVGSRLQSLSNSDAEVLSVRQSWSGLAQSAAVGRSRKAMMDALATRNSLIHVVAHGVADSGLSEDSGLWLTGDDGKPEFVSAFRLRRSDVEAALVVLGACESGVSRANRSLGVGGVAGSLVDAGSAAVVATRWPVSDRVAAEFANAFHSQLAADPTSPEAALAFAVRELRRSPFARHPTHWAGWFLLRAGRVEPAG